jgi:hypothetical protein
MPPTGQGGYPETGPYGNQGAYVDYTRTGPPPVGSPGYVDNSAQPSGYPSLSPL